MEEEAKEKERGPFPKEEGLTRPDGSPPVLKERLNARQRRSQILQKAMELFSHKGFNGTTTREMAREMGISEATIFKHFATKEELYSAILDHKAEEQWLSELIAQMGDEPNEAHLLQTIAFHLIEAIENDPTFLRLLLYSALEGHGLSSLFFDRVVCRLHEFLSDYFRSRIAAGRFRAYNPMLAARAFLGMIIHDLLLQEVFGFPRSGSVPEMVETFVDLFLQGIKTSDWGL